MSTPKKAPVPRPPVSFTTLRLIAVGVALVAAPVASVVGFWAQSSRNAYTVRAAERVALAAREAAANTRELVTMATPYLPMAPVPQPPAPFVAMGPPTPSPEELAAAAAPKADPAPETAPAAAAPPAEAAPAPGPAAPASEQTAPAPEQTAPAPPEALQVPPAEAPAPVETPVPAPLAPVIAAANSMVVEVTQDGNVVVNPVDQESMVKEMKQLQEKFDQLQETVNIVVTQMVSDVETENAQLRAELQRLQARDQAGLLASAAVPKPGGDLINQLADDARNKSTEELDAAAEGPPPGPSEFGFNILKEWGREAEAAAQLGNGAPTLKGAIGFVPSDSSREEIEGLGRELRQQFAQYDNINIEVFDDPVAAQRFVDSQEIDPAHRVLSVSKFAATGRDAVTYYENGDAIDIAASGLAASAAAAAAPDEEAPVQMDAPAPEDPDDTPILEAAPEELPPPPPPAEAPAKKKGRRSGR